jgi:acetolactate decarboxylase
MAYLKGEILILDGKAYEATVINKTTMKVKKVPKVSAPFFGYANISKWQAQTLPDSITSLESLENYLNQTIGTTNEEANTFFRIKGKLIKGTIHLVNLPKGAIVKSPDQAHKGLVKFEVNNESVEILGFYSQQHKTIFTHHDTNMHLHLITSDKKKMGHLEIARFQPKNLQLFLPE